MEPQHRRLTTRPAGRSADTSWTRRSTVRCARIPEGVGSRIASRRRPSFGSRSARTPGTPGRGQPRDGRRRNGAAAAQGRERTGGPLPEAEENGEIAIVATAGGRAGKAEETGAVRSGALAAIGERAVEMTDHLEASGRRGRNGRISEGYLEPEPQPWARQTTARRRARAAGRLLAAQAAIVPCRQQAVTGTLDPTGKECRLPKDAVIPAL